MKIAKILVSVVTLAVPSIVWGQSASSPEVFSPLATGYIERARMMSDEGNYAGVIDQLRHLDTQRVRLSAGEGELYTYLLAKAYYERGDEECVRLLTEFAETYPASYLAPRASLAIADFYFFGNDWGKALEAFEGIDFDRLNREDKTLYTYRKALCMIRSGFYKEARPLVARLKDASGYEDAYNFYTAYLDYIAGDYGRAYNRFMKVAPSIPGLDAGYYMAQIEYKRGEYSAVIDHGRMLLQRKPLPEFAPELQRIVGLSYFHQGQPEVAEGFLEDYFAKTEGTPEADALYAMGAIDYSRGRYNAAIERLSEITDRPDEISQGAWLYIGQCYLKQDNPTAAALAFEKASRLDYDRKVTETAFYNYVTSLTRGGKVPFSSSSNLLENFVERFPDSEYTPEVEGYLATSYYNDRDYVKALGYIDAIRRPSSSIMELKQKVLYELGVEAQTNGKSEKAAGYLSQCVSLKGYDKSLGAQASLWLGDALFQLGRYSEAEKAYSDFIKEGRTSENRALGYYDLAYTRYKLGNYKGAAADFASALTSRPALGPRLAEDATIRRADCLYYIGSYSEATALFTKAIDSRAIDSDYALYRRAILRGLNGDTRSKLEDLSRLEREFPQSRWLSKSLLEQALAYEETGQRDKAADAYKKRLGLATDVDIDELLRMASTMNKSSRWNDLLVVVEKIRHAGGLEADELSEIDLYEADALRHTGRQAEARPLYEQLARNVTSLPGSKAVVALAEMDNSANEFEAARDRMEDFTDAGTPHQYWLARGFIALADAYKGLGSTALAKEYLNSLKENYPGEDDDIDTLIATRLKKWK